MEFSEKIIDKKEALLDEYENLTTLKRLSLDVELLGSFNNELLSWATTLESLEFDGGSKSESKCVYRGTSVYIYIYIIALWFTILVCEGVREELRLFKNLFFNFNHSYIFEIME